MSIFSTSLLFARKFPADRGTLGAVPRRVGAKSDAASSGRRVAERANLQTGRVGKEDYRERRARNFTRCRERTETFNLRVGQSIAT